MPKYSWLAYGASTYLINLWSDRACIQRKYASVLWMDLHISTAIQLLQWYISFWAYRQRKFLSPATTHKPGTQGKLWEPQAGETAPNSVMVCTRHIGTYNAVYVQVCTPLSFFFCFLERWAKWMQWIGVEICQLWSNQPHVCICKWYRHTACLHPAWSAETPDWAAK